MERHLDIAFKAGWEATKTGSAHVDGGRESALGMFLRGFDFGDEEAGESLQLDLSDDRLAENPYEACLRQAVEPFLQWLDDRESSAGGVQDVRDGLIGVEDVLPDTNIVAGAPLRRPPEYALTFGHLRRLRDAYEGRPVDEPELFAHPAPVKADTAAEGWVLVPRVPTEAMIDAPRGLMMYFNSPPGASYPLGRHAESGGYGEGYAHLLTDREKRMHSFPKAHQALLIFRAMLAAAPPPTEGAA
jgi:hypothetical protein